MIRVPPGSLYVEPRRNHEARAERNTFQLHFNIKAVAGVITCAPRAHVGGKPTFSAHFW
jgi:hypothetical protein